MASLPAIGWFFRYGGYSHENCEVFFRQSAQRVESANKKVMCTTRRWDIFGRLHADTSAALMVKVTQLLNAYARNNQDAGFYFAGGTPTPFQVVSAQTLRGVRVSVPPIFPDGKGAQGTTYFDYTLALEWEEPPAVGLQLLLFQESVRRVGRGGSDWDVVAGVTGDPIVMPKTQRSKVTVVQSGRAIGSGFYPLPAPPIWSGSPPFHDPSETIDHEELPGPNIERVTTWSYTYYFTLRPSDVTPDAAGHNQPGR